MKALTLFTAILTLFCSTFSNAEPDIFYVHSDHLGTPQVLTDQDQNVVWKAHYTPFGEAQIVKEDIEFNLRFPGQYFDKETGYHYNYFRTYDPSIGRYLQSDPIGLNGGLNTYAYVGGNPIGNRDPFGLLVDIVLDTKTNQLTITDRDTGQTKTMEAFTGGKASRDGSIQSPGEHPQIPAPAGSYIIVDNPNPTPGHEDWYGLFKDDDRIDDYFVDQDNERSGVRLHKGGLSYGCVTVNKYQYAADQKWNDMRRIINGTSTESIEFIKGPHFWNPTGKTKSYGTLTIQ